MNWLSNILEEIKWKAKEIVWAVQDKITLWKADKSDKFFVGEEVIQTKPKKKKNKLKKKKS